MFPYLGMLSGLESLHESLLNHPSKSNWLPANNTICFGELIQMGYDWGANEYYPDFTGPHRERLNSMIQERFWYREICVTPPERWKKLFVSKLNQIIPKYARVWAVEDAGDLKILRQETYNGKARDVHSAYPQSQLQGTADYADDGLDHAEGHTRDGPPSEMLTDYMDNYKEPEERILAELETYFSCLATTNLGGF